MPNSLPVEFVSDTQFSQLTTGVKNAPKPVENAKPLADKVGEQKLVNELAPKVVDKPEIRTDSSAAEAKTQPKKQAKAEKIRAQIRAEGGAETGRKSGEAKAEARPGRRRTEEGRDEKAAEAGEEAARVQARSDRRGIEKGGDQEAAAVAEVRRQPGRLLARPPRAAASGGDGGQSQQRGFAWRTRGFGRAFVAERARCAARQVDLVLESTAGGGTIPSSMPLPSALGWRAITAYRSAGSAD